MFHNYLNKVVNKGFEKMADDIVDLLILNEKRDNNTRYINNEIAATLDQILVKHRDAMLKELRQVWLKK